MEKEDRASGRAVVNEAPDGSSPQAASIPDAAEWYPLGDLEALADEMFDRWDRDMRAGKTLLALGGFAEGYSEKTDNVRRALSVAPGLLSTLGAIHILASDRGMRAAVGDGQILANIASLSAPEDIAGMFAEMTAQGIEARRAETGTGSVHESPVGNADAPE